MVNKNKRLGRHGSTGIVGINSLNNEQGTLHNLTYAAMVLYVIATTSMTNDVALLKSNEDLTLPLIDVNVSLFGFFIATPLMVLVGYLFVLRNIFRIHKGNNQLPISVKLETKIDIFTDYIFFHLIILSGPAAILFQLARFASYQDKIVFSIHLIIFLIALWIAKIRYHQIFEKMIMPRAMHAGFWFLKFIIMLYVIICIDVIFIPSDKSLVTKIKFNTTLLDGKDGATIRLIPHIKIDKATKLWDGEMSHNQEIREFSGYKDKIDYLVTREVVLDLRQRNLRFLNIQHQILPRVWAHESDFTGANLSFGYFYGWLFVNSKLHGTEFVGAKLDGTAFVESKITQSDFHRASLRGTYWGDSVVRDSDFSFSNLSLATFFGTSINKSNFKESELTAIFVDVFDLLDNFEFALNESFLKTPVFIHLNGKHPALENIIAYDDNILSEAIMDLLCKEKPTFADYFAWKKFLSKVTLFRRTQENQQVNNVLNFIETNNKCNSLYITSSSKSD
jgi:hypothetical protein